MKSGLNINSYHIHMPNNHFRNYAIHLQKLDYLNWANSDCKTHSRNKIPTFIFLKKEKEKRYQHLSVSLSEEVGYPPINLAHIPFLNIKNHYN